MKYAIAKHILWKTVDDEVVIVDPETQEYACLNATGRDLWEMIRQDRSLDGMVTELAGKYDVHEAEARRDAEELLHDLLASGLIEEA